MSSPLTTQVVNISLIFYGIVIVLQIKPEIFYYHNLKFYGPIVINWFSEIHLISTIVLLLELSIVIKEPPSFDFVFVSYIAIFWF
jgi:hypothetical protein